MEQINTQTVYKIKEQSCAAIVKRPKVVKKILFTILLIPALLVSYCFIEPFWVELKSYTIQHSQIPTAFNNTRIVFLTDIHHGVFFSQSRVKKIVEQVNKLNPDLILLGGDYVEGDPKYFEGCFKELGKLSAPLGVFAVLGNHDHWQGADIARKHMKAQNINSVDNGAFWISKNGQKIRIGGVGDHCEDVQKLYLTVNEADLSNFVILVSHSPDYAQELKSDKVDLVFSGHTHGGQVTFFGLYAPKVPSRYGQKFRTGSVTVRNIQVIISNGIGTTLLPIRFFARPQIVIAQLNSQ